MLFFTESNSSNFNRLTTRERKIRSNIETFFKHILALPFFIVPIMLGLGFDPYYFLLKKFLPPEIARRITFRVASFFCRLVIFFLAYFEAIRIASFLMALAMSAAIVMKRFSSLWQSVLRASPRRGAKILQLRNN